MFFILLLFFHSHFLFNVIPHPSVDYRRGFYTPFYTFSPAHRRVIRDTFIFWPFRYLLAASTTALNGHFFYPQAFFTLRSFTDILTCVYQDFPGSRQFFLEACRASYWSSKHRPEPSVCLIHSNPQFHIQNDFSFKFYYILGWIVCDESLIYLLLTRFKLFSLVQSIYKDY